MNYEYIINIQRPQLICYAGDHSNFPGIHYSMSHHKTFSVSTSQYITAVVRAIFSYLSSCSYKCSNERLDILNLRVTEHDQISHVNCWYSITFPLEKINIILQK